MVLFVVFFPSLSDFWDLCCLWGYVRGGSASVHNTCEFVREHFLLAFLLAFFFRFLFLGEEVHEKQKIASGVSSRTHLD